MPWVLVNSSKNRGQGILTTSPKVALGQQVKPSQSLAHPVKKKMHLNRNTENITHLVFHNEIVRGFPTRSHVRATIALQMKEWNGFLFSLDASLLILGIPAGPSPSLSGYPYQDILIRMYLKSKQTQSKSQINWSSFLLSKQKPPK